ncbi:hypothetical protein [Streptomyces albipurpureus]|uniref:DNA primase/polymerase bifunctional N-terminal domain-containing protein n=1 Tax=Streptomyces albipurpureus TaxID=2897419 RepID=A0ABT0UIX6_9ACTN|nr:hypothetical protein [Streptomyces sp. CWNU-1]MCM2388587.1 hypothetical protein [Streptomyces sp. CWNU-1]
MSEEQGPQPGEPSIRSALLRAAGTHGESEPPKSHGCLPALEDAQYRAQEAERQDQQCSPYGARQEVPAVTNDLTTGAERRLAVAHWLLAAAAEPSRARFEWATYGVALLRCGGLFTAVRIPGALVRAAADTEEPEALAEFLAEALHGGPVFHDPRSRQYYVLTPASTARRWSLQDADCLGSNTFLGVPATDRVEPDLSYGAYWVVPMDSPGVLCAGQDAANLADFARVMVAKRQEEEDGCPRAEGEGRD